jgi:hypothetical protein
MESLSPYPDAMLDIVDAVLHLKEQRPESVAALNELLMRGGSVWRVDPSGRRLTRRVSSTATAAFTEAIAPGDVAAQELEEAWQNANARNPSASDAWDHSIKAVEAVLIPLVVPGQESPHIGHVIGQLDRQAMRDPEQVSKRVAA